MYSTSLEKKCHTLFIWTNVDKSEEVSEAIWPLKVRFESVLENIFEYPVLFLISRRKVKGQWIRSSKVRLIPNNRHWKERALWCFNIFQGNCYSMCCLTIPLCAFHDLVVNFVMDYHTGQIYSDQAILATYSSFKFFMSSSRSACFIKLKCAIEWISWFG